MGSRYWAAGDELSAELQRIAAINNHAAPDTFSYRVVAPFSAELGAELLRIRDDVVARFPGVEVPEAALGITIMDELPSAEDIRLAGDTRVDALTGGAPRVFGHWDLAANPVIAKFFGAVVCDQHAPALGGSYDVVCLWESAELDAIRVHFTALEACAARRARRHAALTAHGALVVSAGGVSPDLSASANPRRWARWPVARISAGVGPDLVTEVAAAVTAAVRALPPWARLDAVVLCRDGLAPIPVL